MATTAVVVGVVEVVAVITPPATGAAALPSVEAREAVGERQQQQCIAADSIIRMFASINNRNIIDLSNSSSS